MAFSYLSLRVVERTEFDRKWNQLLQEFARRTITVTPPLTLSDGISGGINIGIIRRVSPVSGASGSSDTQCPFDIILTEDPPATFTITIIPGTVNQAAPDNIFSSFSYTAGTSVYVKLHCLTDGKCVTSVSLVINGTAVDPIPTLAEAGTTAFDILIGVITNGNVYKTWTPCASINATLTQAFIEDNADPVAGLSPYTRWYTWTIAAEE